MSAEIFILPVMRGMNAPAPELPCDCEPLSAPDFSEICNTPLIQSRAKIPYEVGIDYALSEKLEDAADFAKVEIDDMFNAILLWAFAQMGAMNEDEFEKSKRVATAAGFKC